MSRLLRNLARPSLRPCISPRKTWIDTLLQFAPLPELESAYSQPELEPEILAELRRTLRRRHLAREEFVEALRFMDPEETVIEGAEESDKYTFGGYTELPTKEWKQIVSQLDRLTLQASHSAKAKDRAQILSQLAEVWSGSRGHLCMPSLEDKGVFESEFYKGWEQRQRNARMLGIAPRDAALELEQRDELRHAFRIYLRIADTVPGSSLSAQSLWRANDALRRMAEISPWSQARAFETDSTTLSKELHERLLHECPDSLEAKRLSVWWTFPAPAEAEWLPGDWPSFAVETSIAHAFCRKDPGSPKGTQSDRWQERPDYGNFDKQLAQIGLHAGTWELSQLQEELASLRRSFVAQFATIHGAYLINHLDDLELFLQAPPHPLLLSGRSILPLDLLEAPPRLTIQKCGLGRTF